MTPLEFLNQLWEEKPEDHYILLWTGQNKRSHWFLDVTKAAQFAAATTDMDVYVGLALSKEDYGQSRRCKSDEASGICGIGTDLDLKSGAHGDKPLPASVPDALKILPTGMPPSILVLTGNGVHAWWLLKEPLIFDTEEERKATARLLTRWHLLLKRNAAARSWAYDKLSDLARILRIPGTRNFKDPANPKDVTVLSTTECRYNLSDFEEFLDQSGVIDIAAEQGTATNWAEQFANKPLIIDLSKRIPQDRLDAWMKIDMRFRNTWLRQRHDLKDQSQSGYDLALACFGVDAGLPEQQIVNLIVHHRSLYSRTHRTRVDYFQRTIAKAMRQTGGGASAIDNLDTAIAAAVSPKPAGDTAYTDAPVTPPPTTGPAAPQGAPVAPEEPQAANTARELPPSEKDALCAKIAILLKAPIVRLVELDGKDPSFHMHLEGGRVIGFRSYEKFTTQQSVRNAIGAATRKIIPRFKPKAWDELSQWMLNACYIEEPTDEEDLVRGARLHIMHYLKETGFIASIEEERVQDQHKPIVIEDGRIAVSTLDFQAYVAKTTLQKISLVEAASMLVAVGGTKYRVSGRKYDQIRRVLPYPDFDPKEIRPEDAHVAVN
jgi:hypothetical protein